MQDVNNALHLPQKSHPMSKKQNKKKNTRGAYLLLFIIACLNKFVYEKVIMKPCC